MKIAVFALALVLLTLSPAPAQAGFGDWLFNKGQQEYQEGNQFVGGAMMFFGSLLGGGPSNNNGNTAPPAPQPPESSKGTPPPPSPALEPPPPEQQPAPPPEQSNTMQPAQLPEQERHPLPPPDGKAQTPPPQPEPQQPAAQEGYAAGGLQDYAPAAPTAWGGGQHGNLAAVARVRGRAATGSYHYSQHASDAGIPQHSEPQGPQLASAVTVPAKPILLRAEGRDGRPEALSRSDAAQRSKDLAREARNLLKLGDTVGALRAASEAVRLDPGNIDGHLRRAEAHNRLKLYAQAESDSRNALKLDANNPAAWQNLAWSLLKQGRFQEALAAAERAVFLNPNDGTNFAIRAYAKDALGDRREALADLEKAALLDPKFRGKYAQAKDGGRVYDAEDESLLADLVAAAKGGPARWPALAGLAAAAGALVAAGWLLAGRRRLAPAGTALPEIKLASADNGRLAGKYELTRVIGRGGMGEVYEAVDHSLGRPVAVKKVSANLGALVPQLRQYLIQEAKSVAAAHHPSIVQIHEIIEKDQDLYLVFELLRGKTAYQLTVEAGHLSPARALEILRPVCQALDFAHSRGLVHRDLKPGNFMATEQGVVKLMDFGLARSMGETVAPATLDADGHSNGAQDGSLPLAARTRTIVGTPPYMAPEAEKGVVSRQTDVYSLGVSLYEMLTGRLPFNDAKQKATLDFPRPSTFVPGVCPALDEVVLKALAPDPAKRLKSAAEFLALLEAAVAASPASA